MLINLYTCTEYVCETSEKAGIKLHTLVQSKHYYVGDH